jgi:hypothetical protein
MKKRGNMKKINRIFCAVFVLLALCANASAAEYEPSDISITPYRASDYLDYYYAWTDTGTNGEVIFYFDVDATGKMDLVGVTGAVIQYKSGSTWLHAATIIGTTNNGLLREDAYGNTGYISYTGITGRQYRAVLTFYAGDTTGYDTRNYTTSNGLLPV